MSRLDRDSAPLIIGFGSKAKSGKSECSQAIYDKFSKTRNGEYDILRTSFAAALRREVELAIEGMDETIEGMHLTMEAKVKDLCLLCGVDYDPEAPVCPTYPYSKQRKLLQYWGTDLRRAENPFYWVNALDEAILREAPKIVLIDDVRFPNELFWVHHLRGTVIQVDRPDYVSDVPQHASETALDDYEFDYIITSVEGQVDQLRSDAIELFDTIVKRWSGAECASVFQTFGDLVAVKES